MLSERYLRRRYRQGREEGQVEERSKWEEWTRQFMEDGLLPPDIEIPPPDSDGKKKEPSAKVVVVSVVG